MTTLLTLALSLPCSQSSELNLPDVNVANHRTSDWTPSQPIIAGVNEPQKLRDRRIQAFAWSVASIFFGPLMVIDLGHAILGDSPRAWGYSLGMTGLALLAVGGVFVMIVPDSSLRIAPGSREAFVAWGASINVLSLIALFVLKLVAISQVRVSIPLWAKHEVELDVQGSLEAAPDSHLTHWQQGVGLTLSVTALRF